MGRTVAEALNLSVSLSTSRVLSPLFIFLHQSVWFCLSVCPPLLRGSTFSLTWYFYLFFIVVFIHHSISFASFIYLCICTYLRPFIHQSSCLSFVSVYFTFHIFHLAKLYIYIFIYLSIKKNHVFSHLSPCLSLSLSRDVETYNVLWKSDPSAMQQAPFCTSRLEPNVTWSQSHEEVALTAEMHLRLNFPPFEWLSRKWPSEPTVRGARPVSHIGRAKRKLMRTLERKAPWIRIACRKTRDLC